MIALKSIQTIVGLLTLFLAYLFTIAPAGCFRAWVAKKMGDTTAEEMGFLTLNPLAHIDFFGVIWLLLFSRPEYFSGFGWGKYVPIDPRNITGNYRWFKLMCAFFSDSFAHFIMSALALIATGFMFDGKVIFTTLQDSSFSLVIFKILFAFTGLNIALTLVRAVIDAVVLIALYISEGNASAAPYFYYLVLLAPIIILLLFGSELQHLIVYGVTAIGNCIGNMLS